MVREFCTTMTELSEQLKIFFSALSLLTKHGESALFGKIMGQAIVDELAKNLRISAGWRHHY
jgi:hypothetical protein